MRGCAGLDFGSIEEAHERLLKKLPNWELGRRSKAWYLGAGFYDRKVPTWAAGVMGFVGLAVPAQASHAVFRTGEKSQILFLVRDPQGRVIHGAKVVNQADPSMAVEIIDGSGSITVDPDAYSWTITAEGYQALISPSRVAQGSVASGTSRSSRL